jgi:hypothetical protein
MGVSGGAHPCGRLAVKPLGSGKWLEPSRGPLHMLHGHNRRDDPPAFTTHFGSSEGGGSQAHHRKKKHKT